MKQLKASMPDELAERLERASTKAGRSLSAEICARIEASFAQEAVDKPTRDFLEGVALMPAEIELETGAAWHKHAGAHEVFTQAIQARLDELKPKGSSAFGDRPHATVFEPTLLGSPTQLGSMIEYRLRRQPDFTNSPTRQLMEEEHRRAKLYQLGMVQVAQRGKPAPTILGGAEKKRGK
jgi:hypothetical protein